MKLRLYKMGIVGKVAVANLCVFALVLATFLIAFPGGLVEQGTPAERVLSGILLVASYVLSFPVGWLGHVVFDGGVSGPPVSAVVFVPLNAYFWGYVVATFVGWRESRRARGG